MKGYIHSLCSGNQSATHIHIYIPVGCQCPYHYAVGTYGASLLDVALHTCHFMLIIKEIAASGTNKHMHCHTVNPTCLLHQPHRWCNPTYFKRRTQFNACRTAIACRNYAFNTSGTHFEQSFHQLACYKFNNAVNTLGGFIKHKFHTVFVLSELHF